MNSFDPLIPLLVPSFSSKGNLLIPCEEGRYISDNYDLPQALNVRISKTYLISAYDVYYGLMPQNPSDWPYTEYLFIDSGGYEINDSFDLSERNKFNYKVFPWDHEKMESIYDRIVTCPKFENTNIILSVFDGDGSLEEQLQSAIHLKNRFPTAFINFIIKMNFPVDELLHGLKKNSSQLALFSIIGFTEKELGQSLKERLLNILNLRQQLTSCGWYGYLHIFGGLEPNYVKLFYCAGADIFDGLSWQRTRYQNDSTLFAPDKYIINLSEYKNKYLMMVDNLAFMQDMSNTLSVVDSERKKYATALREELAGNGNICMRSLLRELEV